MYDLFYREDVFLDYDHGDKRHRGYDFTIDYQGRWYFHGGQNPGPIKRKSLAALFGGAGIGFMAGKGLMRDKNGDYWLESPDGRYKVEVEDVPFIITRFQVNNIKENQMIDLYTNFDELVPLGPGRSLALRPEPRKGAAVLYADIRAGLWARFSTQAYNSFAAELLSADGECYRVISRGHTFELKENGFS